MFGLYADGVPVHAKTQKAKGIKALGVSVRYFLTKEWMEEDPDEAGEYKYPSGHFPLFARPCPMTPQHGFVESRIVHNWKEVVEVMEETLAADPDGELILADPIDAQWNAIWTPHLLSVGEGHDGATSGKNTSSVGLGGANPFAFMMPSAGMVAPDVPYVEVVADGSNQVHLVQLRGGPPVGQVKGTMLIPSEITVQDIYHVDPNQDLMAFQKVVQDMDVATTAIWHPGGSLIDHFSVHARIKGLALFLGGRPMPGVVYSPTMAKPPVFTGSQVLIGAAAAENIKFKTPDDMAQALAFVILITHNMMNQDEEHGGIYLGAAATLLLRLGSLAVRGEARHFQGLKSKSKGKEARQVVYARYANRDLSFHITNLNRFINLFRYGSWNGSFGGPKWAACGMSLLPVFRALKALSDDPTTSTVPLMEAMNMSLHQAHNNGWWLNKFAQGDPWALIPQGDLMASLVAMRPLLAISTLSKAVSGTEWEDWAHWNTDLSVPKVDGIHLDYSPYSSAFQITLMAQGYNNTNRTFLMKFSDTPMSKLAKALKGNLSVRDIGGQAALFVEIPGAEPVPLWIEPTISLQKEHI